MYQYKVEGVRKNSLKEMMRMFHYVVTAGSVIIVVLGLYVLLKTKRTYDQGKELPIGVSIGWWAIDAIHCLLVIMSSLFVVWSLPINKIVASIAGSAMLGFGAIFMLAGMIEFRSIRRISGFDTSELVTTGVYRWSRNPQSFGWFLVLLGISLIGSSGLALSYTVIGIVLFHLYIIKMEEPYLERMFAEKYVSYKERTPRYIGIPKRRKGKPEFMGKSKEKIEKEKPFDVMFQTKRADWVFVISATLVFILALLVTVWDFVHVQGMIYRFGIANVVGLGLFLMGVSIRIVARRTLGKYFSSDLKTSQKHELIKHGIYRHIRHPAYLGSLLLSPGIPMIFSSLYGFLLMLGLIPCFLYRIKIEESMLLEKFGDEYREYMKKTRKMIPFIY